MGTDRGCKGSSPAVGSHSPCGPLPAELRGMPGKAPLSTTAASEQFPAHLPTCPSSRGLNVYPRPRVASFPQMLQGLLGPLLLAALVVMGAAMPPPEQCQSEMNKIKDLLQVSCVDQGLTSIPNGLPKDTGILLLASNQLAKVALASFQHLPQLSDLDLSNNSLKVLETGAALPKLKHLFLSHNDLERLPTFLGLPSLCHLALGHNQLSQLPEGAFRGLGQLEELELQGNHLQSLPGRAFEGLEMLKDLDLSDNRLEALPPDLLSKLSNLIILQLERNRLERVPDGFFLEQDYAYIYLVGNPWMCDCQLVYLRDWINNNSIIVYTRTTVQEDGLDKEVTENEPHKVVCQAPPEEKDQPVMSFQAACKNLRDDSWTASQAPSSPLMATAPTIAQLLAASRLSSHSPSTAISPTGATLTTTRSMSALSSTTTLSPITTSPGPTTTHVLTTTAAVVTFSFSTRGITAGRSTATSNVPTMTPGPSTTHISKLPPALVPTTMATSCTPLAHSSTASILTTPLPPSVPPPTTTATGHPPNPAALVPSTPTPTHVKSSPRISAPLSTRTFSPPPPPKPSAHCLCPALPVRVLGVAARKGSHADWLAGYCCLLRLVLYLACLVLVALPTLALLCWMGWLHLSWYLPALQGAPGSHLARSQQWQKASTKEWQMKFSEAPRPTSGPRIYRVCKKFQVAPSRHVTWLLVSLPGSAGKWAQMQTRLSSYSLDRGKDTLGAVRVKYASASL